MKIFVAEVPIFDVSIAVCTGCTAEEAQNQFYDLQGYRSVVNIPDRSDGACYVPEGASEIYMWVDDPMKHASTVFHELVHVAMGICDQRGMDQDEELIAYLMGWLKKNVADRIFFEEEPPSTMTARELADQVRTECIEESDPLTMDEIRERLKRLECLTL